MNAVRIALVVLWIGSWELAARTVIDPFYYSMPSKIWDKLVIWFTEGTSQGSIWSNIAITLEEAVLGFLIGTLMGVVLGVLLGRAASRPRCSRRSSRAPTRSRASCSRPCS